MPIPRSKFKELVRADESPRRYLSLVSPYSSALLIRNFIQGFGSKFILPRHNRLFFFLTEEQCKVPKQCAVTWPAAWSCLCTGAITIAPALVLLPLLFREGRQDGALLPAVSCWFWWYPASAHESLLLKCQTCMKPLFRRWLCSFEGWYKKRSSLYQSPSNLLSRASYDQTLRACWSSLSRYRQTQKHQDHRTLVSLPLETVTCAPAPCIYSCLLCFRSASTKTLQWSLGWCFSIILQKEECQAFSAHSNSSLHLTISSLAEVIHHPEKVTLHRNLSFLRYLWETGRGFLPPGAYMMCLP